MKPWQKVKSSKMLQSARGQSCVLCGAEDGTVVSAHYSGLRKHELGGGRGLKVHDLLVADLCYRCHTRMDNYEQVNSYQDQIERSELFLALIARTLLRRVSQGVIEISDMRILNNE